MLRRLPIILAALLLTGCGKDVKRSPVVRVSRDPKHGYEIELDCSYRSFGGPCNFPQMPHRISESHWIYTDRIEGEVSTNHLILTYERGKTEPPWPQEALQGRIRFANNYLHVDLQLPYFADGTNITRGDLDFNLEESNVPGQKASFNLFLTDYSDDEIAAARASGYKYEHGVSLYGEFHTFHSPDGGTFVI
ncbi:MAG TPA: hypothetical protein VLT36_05680 [Candidatus Dormibacteraeota bacterium]|nr:hypothetical protein [Candidatus Dormibacteraeota bacterium]